MPEPSGTLEVTAAAQLDTGAMISLATMPPSSLKNRVLMASSRLPLAYSNAPDAMPTSREVYTSLVFSASTMAITGGSSEKMVLYTAQV
ncbi:Uncharacterised protein [Alistipes sp. cv1]|nr:Uncharacterised protein [Faecalibacterium prausnitzii]